MNISILYFFLHLTEARPALISLARFFSEYLVYILPIVVVGYIYLFEEHPRRQRAAYVFFSVIVAYALTDLVFKDLFAVLRPFITLHYVPLIPETGFSFPSGHATIAGALAVASIFSISKHRLVLGILVTVLCLGIGLSRVMLGVHYPTDVIAGLLFGGLVAYLGHHFSFRKAF